ncbi:hypothetical protein DCAR_0100401 [Daucus carota subsp. sativus]|uniref:Uncharacterized protein n=1 Tax=Daucus carota subsp. sativus TaxID=79200 RepID=A0A166FML6_DAUCS|nr:hypothetical protein DCAR_0100401 [Daucus carota subsp. sativus]
MFRIVKGGGIKLDFSSTRCGEFPGFQQMRTMFTSYFWKEFVARGAELRYNCKANTKAAFDQAESSASAGKVEADTGSGKRKRSPVLHAVVESQNAAP